MLQAIDATPGPAIARGALRPGRLLWLRRLGWGLALGIAVAAANLPPNLARSWLHIQRGTVASFALLVVALLAMLGAYAASVHWGERRRVTELSLHPAARDLAAGIAVGVGVFSLAMAGLLAGGWYTIEAGPPGPPWSGLGIGFGAGVAEELIFRGIVMRLIWQRAGAAWAVALSALIFGLAHLANPGHDWVGPVYIVFEAGLLLGGLYALTGRLWASIGAHAGWNFTQGYIFGAEVSGNDPGGHWLHSVPVAGAPSLFTGGAFGPEGSVACLAAGTAAGLIVLAMAFRHTRPAGWAGA